MKIQTHDKQDYLLDRMKQQNHVVNDLFDYRQHILLREFFF